MSNPAPLYHLEEFMTSYGPAWMVTHEERVVSLQFDGKARALKAAKVTLQEVKESPSENAAVRVRQALENGLGLSGLELSPRGTPFQQNVWQALREIPRGETRSYRALAESLGKVKAVRAVAQACGANPIAILIPCHRVIGSQGSLTGYRWGLEMKRQLLQEEGSLGL